MDCSVKKRRLNEDINEDGDDVRTDNNGRNSSLIEDTEESWELLDVDYDESNDSHADVSNSVIEPQNIEHSTRIIQDARSVSNTLNEFTRSDLIIHLARSYLEDKVILSTDRIRKISQEICSAFPDEDMASYFIEPIGKKAPGGRFFNHYQSQLKKFRQKNLIPKSSRAINKMLKAVEGEEIYVLSGM
ncbi:uncharacterized protein LOC119076304 [Bradysia coprophila]|uniref:uncharacterized protein LOC119076304 n=1 Tax=Bradysia coprophila TaxID=38358 RepID=UPI00187D804D|nr:uncharacterized protein LOC119076304 [Bradysia coprophila]